MKTKRGRLLAASVVTATTCWAVTGPTPGFASAAPARPGGPGCVTVDFIEPTPSFYSNIPITPQAPYTVGFQGAAFDKLYDAAGTQIGTSVVASDNVFQRASDGHVFEHIAETMNLADGTLAGTGTFDRTTVAAQGWLHGRITGLSGRYAGLSGEWTWRLNAMQPPYPAHEIGVLCGHGDGDESGS